MADLEALGADEATMERYRAVLAGRDGDDGPLAIPPENHAVVRLFERSFTQRLYAGAAGVCVGLDYTGVEATARMTQTETTGAMIDDLRLMEAEMLRLMREDRR